jgi:hypothetical protein
VRKFIWLCLRAAFSHSPWEKAQAVAAALFCVIGLVTFFAPRLLSWAPKIDEWVVLTFVFGAIILFRLLMSPYWVYKDACDARDSAILERNALKADTDARRAEQRQAENRSKLVGTICLQLSKLMAAGNQLLIKTRSGQFNQAIESEADKWFELAKDFIGVSLGETAVHLFTDTSGIATPAFDLPEKFYYKARTLYVSIYPRVCRLRELIDKLQSGEIKPRD